MSGKIINSNTENETSQKRKSNSIYNRVVLLVSNLLGLGNIATMLGIIGGIITIIGFINQRPRIVLNPSKVELGSTFSKDEYLEVLRRIENDYSDHTGDIVVNLIKILDDSSIEGFNKKQNVEKFEQETRQAITELKTTFGREVYEDIIEELNNIENNINNDQDISNTLTSLENLEEEYSEYTKQHIVNIIDDLKKTSSDGKGFSIEVSELKLQIKDAILQFSTLAFQVTSDDDNEKELIFELEKVTTSLQDYIKGNKDRIFVEVAIENRSDLKNLIHNKGMITFFDSTDNFTQFRDIPYISVPINTVSEKPTIIEDQGLITLIFQSDNVNTFSQNYRDSILTSFKESYRYIIVVEDINEKLWNSYGRISTGFNNKSDNEKRLERESELLLKNLYR